MAQIRPANASREGSPGRDGSDQESKPQRVSLESAMNLEAYLQQPMEDDIIVKELIQLETRIESYSNDYHHKNEVKTRTAELRASVEIAIAHRAPEKVDEFVSLLIEPRSRAAGIRIMVGRILFERIRFCGDHRNTLLPPAVISLTSAFKFKAHPEEAQEYYQLAFARWRILSRFLLPDFDNKIQSVASEQQIRDAVDTINDSLGYFVGEEYIQGKGKEEREKSLGSIINRVAKLGALLFSQAATWHFDWNKGIHAPQGFVVFPAAWKTGDTDGRMLPDAILRRAPEIHSPAGSTSAREMVNDSPIEQNSDEPSDPSVKEEPGSNLKDASVISQGLEARPEPYPAPRDVLEPSGQNMDTNALQKSPSADHLPAPQPTKIQQESDTGTDIDPGSIVNAEKPRTTPTPGSLHVTKAKMKKPGSKMFEMPDSRSPGNVNEPGTIPSLNLSSPLHEEAETSEQQVLSNRKDPGLEPRRDSNRSGGKTLSKKRHDLSRNRSIMKNKEVSSQGKFGTILSKLI